QALRVVIFLHRFSLPWKKSISDILSRQVNNRSIADKSISRGVAIFKGGSGSCRADRTAADAGQVRSTMAGEGTSAVSSVHGQVQQQNRLGG
ncbi:MAG: hypothetical protein ABW068_07500, partial [Candidatus Thiodiazotropha sp.]